MHPFLAKVTSDELLAELTSREAFGRAAEPWEVANVIVFLASDYSTYMTGEVVSVSSQHPSTRGVCPRSACGLGPAWMQTSDWQSTRPLTTERSGGSTRWLAGLNDDQIAYRIESRRWECVVGDVYRLYGVPATWKGELLAACWAGGFRAVGVTSGGG